MNANSFVVVRAVREVFSSKNYFVLAMASATVSAALFFFLPIFLIPGNSVELQVSLLYDASSWIVLLLFSALVGVVVPMQVFIIARKLRNRGRRAGMGIASTLSVFTAGMFSIKACPVCLAVVFGFLGFPAVLFFLSHQRELSLLAIMVSGISIYFSSKSIAENCEACKT